jgi:hypothetical protein
MGHDGKLSSQVKNGNQQTSRRERVRRQYYQVSTGGWDEL